MHIEQLNQTKRKLENIIKSCPDAQINTYLRHAIARISMLQRRWAKRGDFKPDTHPKGPPQ
jgi:hypothetical protein